MDRTQYGLRQPTDAYRPFDIACKTKPLPGYALLADLQSSVSGPTHSPGPRVHPPPSVSHHQSPTTAYAHSSPVSYTHRSPGPQPHHNGEFRHNPDSITHYANGDVDTNPQKKVYYQESKEEVRTESRSSGPNPAPEPKTDELESLLSELNSSRYTGIVDRSSGAMAQPASAGRPSVDYLLNELNSVNSTSRTTTSQNHMPSNHMPSNPPLAASTATRDLDDLMAELSDIKLNRTDTYAKPQKPRSPSPAPPPPPPAVKDPSPPAVNELDCMLGSLTTHMTEQGVNTHNKGSCCACDKPIVGQVITALGKTWHPEHFKCGHCKQELGSKNFFERDGKPYCEACYHELFSPRCAYCGGAILDKCVTALDKNWHPDHFFCAQCGNTFGEEGFHEKDGKAYCREDYYNMFAPKCGGCNSPIMENYISALNAQWHPECFVCRDCKKPVTGKSYYAMENKPVCAACVGVSDDEEDGEEED